MRTHENLLRAVKLELIHWRPIQARELGTPFYLWHQPHTPERTGGVLVARKQPRGYERTYPHPMDPRLNVDQNLERILASGCLDNLPVFGS